MPYHKRLPHTQRNPEIAFVVVVLGIFATVALLGAITTKQHQLSLDAMLHKCVVDEIKKVEK